MNSLGYVHRDVKPDNVMIHSELGAPLTADNFKLCDFGLAVKEGATKFIYKRCGTPGFVPPEVVKAADDLDLSLFSSSKWDTFSTGVILYMLISRVSSPSRIIPFPRFKHKTNPGKSRRMQSQFWACSYGETVYAK
jgi:serine/threonine protein kinase